MKQIQITISGTPDDIALQEKALNQFAKLPIDDKKRVSELIINPKALAGLKKHWLTLKLMFK